MIRLPDAGQPVGHKAEDADQQDQNSCSVLQVVVQLPSHPAQTQQADHLQGAEEAADALRGRTELELLQENMCCPPQLLVTTCPADEEQLPV